jgi:hypothetical protein
VIAGEAEFFFVAVCGRLLIASLQSTSAFAIIVPAAVGTAVDVAQHHPGAYARRGPMPLAASFDRSLRISLARVLRAPGAKRSFCVNRVACALEAV